MPVGKPFIELFEVDSTNNYAMAQVQASLAGHGTAWFAHTQNQGKGQRNKTWITEPGQNIILSIALTPAGLPIEHQFLLSATIAVACVDFLNNHTTLKAKIKWPNDIYLGDRKAGGILIENILRGQRWKYSIAGIGININQLTFPADLINAISLAQITGRHYNVIELAVEVCKCIDRRWEQLHAGGVNGVLTDYHQALYKLNKWVNLNLEGTIIRAKIKQVNEKGELLVTTTNGKSLAIKQAEWIFN